MWCWPRVCGGGWRSAPLHWRHANGNGRVQHWAQHVESAHSAPGTVYSTQSTRSCKNCNLSSDASDATRISLTCHRCAPRQHSQNIFSPRSQLPAARRRASLEKQAARRHSPRAPCKAATPCKRRLLCDFATVASSSQGSSRPPPPARPCEPCRNLAQSRPRYPAPVEMLVSTISSCIARTSSPPAPRRPQARRERRLYSTRGSDTRVDTVRVLYYIMLQAHKPPFCSCNASKPARRRRVSSRRVAPRRAPRLRSSEPRPDLDEHLDLAYPSALAAPPGRGPGSQPAHRRSDAGNSATPLLV